VTVSGGGRFSRTNWTTVTPNVNNYGDRTDSMNRRDFLRLLRLL
jgi:hypothetical protein